MDKTMVTKVIDELECISRLKKIFPETSPWYTVVLLKVPSAVYVQLNHA